MTSLFRTRGLRRVLDALPQARLVGGAVRDRIAGRPIADIDLATPDTPDDIVQALERADILAVPTGRAHGTITAISRGHPFEITTLRRDAATDGRHATVVWTDDWQLDAARRDFTINAMSMDRQGRVFDYFLGQRDLAAGKVRFVGDPATRIAEDYLRILRFFRFWARYGRGEPDADAVAAIASGTPGLARLSAERVWSELKRILQGADPAPAVGLMHRLGVLDVVLPECADPARLAALTAGGAPADPLLRLAALLTGDGAAMAARLKLAKAEATRLAALQAGPVPAVNADDASLRRMLADEKAPVLIDRTWLAGGFGPEWDGLRTRLGAMQQPVFQVFGRDALALGAGRGAAVGVALRATRDWWRAGGCVADKQACLVELASALQRADDLADHGPAS